MKLFKYSFFLLIFLFSFTNIYSEETIDSLFVDLDEVTIVSTRETRIYHEQPLSYTNVGLRAIEKSNVVNLHDLSSYVPNFFMPEYGSKITSSIFIRGIGSRMGDASVGMYVDDIPILDKSGFDFDFYDVQNIDILRGPQATIYGRNSIAGLINISTLSPFKYQGTRIFGSYGTANDIRCRVSTYQNITDKLAFSAGIFFNKNDGYFTNTALDEKNWMNSFGGRAKLEWKFAPKWQVRLSLQYEKNKQGIYPYAPLKADNTIGTIDYNDPSGYVRDMFISGLTFQRTGDTYLFTSATSFQLLNDAMTIDQDFTPEPIFTLTQNQKMSALTQEFVARSRTAANYQWITGLFGFYKAFEVDAPVLFKEGGMNMIQSQIDAATGGNPMAPKITINNTEMPVPGLFDVPAYGLSFYHQSSYTFWDKLTLTAGIRFEYEKTAIDYNTYAGMNVTVTMPPMVPRPPVTMDMNDTIKGKLTQDFFQILPKAAIKYDITSQFNIYASVSKGYKTGGFNYQMLSDVLMKKMQSMPGAPGGNDSDPLPEDMIPYKPESTVNYEIGTHSEPIRNKLFLDLALYYIDFKDQQIVTYVENGSREMKNAGRSVSKGFEANVRALVTKDLNLHASYGFTDAKFKEYKSKADFSGKYIPLVPRNTFSIGADYTLHTNLSFLDRVNFNAQYNAQGKLYFIEDNVVSQDFYGLLNANITLEKAGFKLSVWGKNLTDTDYYAFYLETSNRPFVQQGKPLQCGLSLQYVF
jgi:outer membrane receptor protein involved in Fe transport